MTKPKGTWKSKNEAEFIILKNLVMRGPMESVQFEKLDDPVPHASVAKILRESLNNNLIKKVSERSSKRGLPVPSFKITLFGLIRLFLTMKESNRKSTTREIRDLIISSQDLLPWIAKKWNGLSRMYNELGMFNLLTSVCEACKVMENPEQEHFRKAYESGIFEFEHDESNARIITIEFQDDHQVHIDHIHKTDEEALDFWLTIYFVFGLARYANVTKDVEIRYFPELYLKNDNPLQKLMSMLDDSTIKDVLVLQLEEKKAGHIEEASILDNLLKALNGEKFTTWIESSPKQKSNK